MARGIFDKGLFMKKWLQEKLVCPECTMDAMPLDLEIKEERDGDVLEGELRCPTCGSCYPINQGVAVVLPKKARSSKSFNSDKHGLITFFKKGKLKKLN